MSTSIATTLMRDLPQTWQGTCLELKGLKPCFNVATSVEHLSNIGKGLAWDWMRDSLGVEGVKALFQCGYFSGTPLQHW